MLVLMLPQLLQVGFHPLALVRRESADVLIGVLHSLFRHDVGHGGHAGFLQQARNHLRSNHVAGVVEQLNRRGGFCRRSEGDGILPEAAWE